MILYCKIPHSHSVDLASLVEAFPGIKVSRDVKGGMELAWDDGRDPPPPVPFARWQYGDLEVLAGYLRDYRRPDPQHAETARRIEALPRSVKDALDGLLRLPEVVEALARVSHYKMECARESAEITSRAKEFCRRVREMCDDGSAF